MNEQPRYKRKDNVTVNSIYKLEDWSYGTILFKWIHDTYIVCSYDGVFRCAIDKESAIKRKTPYYLGGFFEEGFSLKDRKIQRRFWNLNFWSRWKWWLR